MYDEVGDLDFPDLEQRVLAFWETHGVFQKLREKNKGGQTYSFLDGPITANNPRGLGVHHAWGRTYKDIFQRHRAMQGYELRYQNGFDCQGLWVEVEVEKDLGLDGKQAILEYGLANFARRCRERVDESAEAIVRASKRLGQWMDWDHSYHTYSDGNIEHIWRFLKECHRRGWLYRGERVMPWCTRCGTSLSQHELTDSYKEVVHRVAYVALQLTGRPDERILVWTTTPWTLPANVALAVHPDVEYARVRDGDQILLLSRAAVQGLLPSATVLDVIRGADLVGEAYTGPFDELPVQGPVVHRIVAWDQVDEKEGTGVVHIAPGCGAEDFELAREAGLPVLAPLREDGTFQEGYGALSAKSFLEANDWVREDLEGRNLLYRSEELSHRYPHCWRCGMQLVFRLVGEWFIACDEVRPLMLAAARQARWIPEHSGKRMEDWLRNMGDWCISRKRYWGLPLPFYESDDGELVVVGSVAELRELATDPDKVDALSELHRPWIDAVEVRTPSGATARRVSEVGDCWLDAGIVPFSTLDYQEGDEQAFARWFPVDFIVEMREQIRLWYYSMLFMSVVLDGRTPYRTVMTYEKMADESGAAMHKSAGNAVWFDEAVEQVGAEPMRWLFAGQNLSLNISFGYGPLSEVKRRFLTLWNSYRFYVQYANLDNLNPMEIDATQGRVPIDRWLRSQLQVLVGTVGQALDAYELPTAVRAVEEFFDDLSNWYVRLCRRRFWRNQNDADKAMAHATLYEALTTLTRLLAPVLPFLAEEIYRNLVSRVDSSSPESVHLCGYPQAQPELIDEELTADMARVRQVVTMGRAIRAAKSLKVRQPLARVLVVGDEAVKRALDRLGDLVLQELNVKVVVNCEDETEVSDYVLKPDLPALGRRFGARLPAIRAALAEVDAPDAVSRLREGRDVTLHVGCAEVVLGSKEIVVETEPKDGLALGSDDGLTVALDVRLGEDLIDEGRAREFVHFVQGIRRQRKLSLHDRIAVEYKASELLVQSVERHAAHVCAEILCVELIVGMAAEGEPFRIGNEEVVVQLRRVPSESP
jgi:isoleucyl-tRNA synthetase